MSKKHIKRNAALILSLVMLFVVVLPITTSAAIKVTAPKQIFVDISGTAQINVVTAPAADLTTLGITYKSANEQIATVDNTGLVSGIGKGSTTISVQYGKKTYKVTALVSEKGVPYTDGATFSIEYPESWTVKETTVGELKYIAFVSPLANSLEQGGDNLVVGALDTFDPTIPLDDYTSYVTTTFKQALPNFKLLSTKKLHLRGYEARSIIFTFKLGGFSLKDNQMILVSNNKAFSLCYTAQTKTYDKYSIELQKMLNSFKVLG